MPQHYSEWIEASYQTIVPSVHGSQAQDDRAQHSKAQSLLERVNNLQNLLFVIDAVDAGTSPRSRGPRTR